MKVFRNFLFILRRFKVSSILNILGLSAAFAVFMIIVIQSIYDLTYNRSFDKSDNLATVRFYRPSDEYESETISMTLAKQISEKIPEIENYSIFSNQGKANYLYKQNKDGNESIHELNTLFATKGFLEMFTPEIVRGNTSGLHDGFDQILLTESEAKKIFANEDPIGKVIRNINNDNEYTVVAICKDFPKNCFLKNGAFVNLRFNPDESEWSYRLYFDIPVEMKDVVLEKLNSEEVLSKELISFFKEHPEARQEVKLFYLKDMHLQEGNNKNTLISLLAIGIIILLIAFINFINFSMAMVPSRIKSINVYKILGSGRKSMMMSLLFEGVFLALIAVCIALLIIYVFSASAISQFFAADLNLSTNLTTIIILAFILVGLTILAGIYPSRYALSFPEAVALNNSFALSPRGAKLQNILIVIQFIGAIGLCSVAYFIKIQHDYMKNYSIGIERENIVYLPLRGIQNIKTVGEEMLKNPHILEYTASESVPGNIGMGWGRVFEGNQVQFTSWPVTPNFLDFFGIKTIAGENFTESKNDSIDPEQIILNESFLEKYGLKAENILGKSLFGFSEGVVKGIAADINFQSVYYPIEPMGFVVLNGKYREKRLNYFFLKISGDNIPSTIDYIEKVWSKFNKEEFQLTFLDEQMDKLYKHESDMAKLISLFALISIIIAMMGIYGLIMFNTRYKRKEIAIRKVNGATVFEIIVLLNKNFLWLLGIAFLVSVPVAYYAIMRWLEEFPFKAQIPWWLFIAAALLVLFISVLTVSWQSYRAATANPVDSLKSE